MMWQRLALGLSRAALPMLAGCAFLFGSTTPTQPAHAEPAPVVAAAASLRHALDDIATAFEQQTGRQVRLTYGATRSLTHQIENGAPYELFLAADTESVKRLADKSLTDGEASVFARGRIVIMAIKGSPVSVDSDLIGLADALGSGKVDYVSIANPEVAPYGRAAQEALQKAGLWESLKKRLVIGENVGQATQFATTGAAQAGIIARSLAVSSNIGPRLSIALVPEDWHQPINHSMALLKGAGQTARAFAAFLKSDPGREILERTGLFAP